MKDALIYFLNKTLIRLLFGVIISGTIMSPWLNGFSEHVVWFSVAILFFLLVMWSLICQYQFTKRNVWILYTVLGGFAVLVVYLFFAFGR